MVNFLFLLTAISPAFASLPSSEWIKVDHPSVDAFFSGTRNKEYLTVVKNQADEKMNFNGQSDANIAHVLTLLRRVSLAPFGISDWKIDKLSQSLYKNQLRLQIQGTYINKSGNEVSFFERMYFHDKKFTQLSWIQTEGAKSSTSERIEGFFKELETEYL